MNTPKVLFFTGKGGTGKSTISALAGLTLSLDKSRVMVTSLDSAHNLSDIFKIKLSDTPMKITTTLFAREVDQNRIIKSYLKNTRDALKRTYAYLTAFNLDHYFDILKHSPGLEEYALIMAFQFSLEKFSDFDYLIFDMPPTALSLKFFNLPFLSGKWIEHLKTLRQEINEKKKIVSRIKFAGKAYTKDKILVRIEEMKAGYEKIEAFFKDHSKTSVFVVLNNNPLAAAESAKILNDLEQKEIFVKKLIWNRVSPQVSETMPSESVTSASAASARETSDQETSDPMASSIDLSFFPDYVENLYFPEAVEDLFGIRALRDYIKSGGLTAGQFQADG
ncbi:MAG: TRC40/GET3/ArsA family transport-energizing ATPase [Thermodesulfobacteriota bacterium]|nr:TRC40/GET3/ArsA family transport-energizing ATPase [Thermodesulfobacteriota bacterium]